MINTGGSWQWFSVRRAWSWQQAVASQCPENVGSCYSLVNFTFRSPRDCWHLVTCLPLLHGESSDCLAETSKEFVQIFLSPSLCRALLVSCSCLSLPWRLLSRARPAHRVLLQCPTAQHSTTEGVSSELGDRNSPRCWTLARAHSTWATPLPPSACVTWPACAAFFTPKFPLRPPSEGRWWPAGAAGAAHSREESRQADRSLFDIRCQHYVMLHLTLDGANITMCSDLRLGLQVVRYSDRGWMTNRCKI